MKLNWNFLGEVGVQNKRPSVGGVWIFSGTAHYNNTCMCSCKLINEVVVRHSWPLSFFI